MTTTFTNVRKTNVEGLAALGGERLFVTSKSTSNLVRPVFGKFLDYSRVSYEQHHYTNNGPLVRLLEQRLAAFHDAQHCITFCSGFWALALAMKLMALPGKSEVVMPSLTYRRMADLSAWVRLKPRFCEVEEATLGQSAATVEPCITDDTGLILGVHPIVNCCDIEGLQQLAQERRIPLLFDSVESVYETIPAGKVGRFGGAECFSLHASKLMNGFEGGYVTTNDSTLARRLALTRGYGFEGESNVVLPNGINAKMNEVHAAMALASLDDIEDQVVRNRRRYELYRQILPSVPEIRLVEFDETQRTAYKNIVVELLDGWPLTREVTLRLMNSENILARAYYSPPLHRKPMAYPCVPADLPRTDRLASRFMLLPCGHFVADDDIREVVAFLGFIHDHAVAIAARVGNSTKDQRR